MTVLGITSATNPYQSGYASRAAQVRQDFQGLGRDLNSGDLSLAQQTLNRLLENLPPGQAKEGNNPDSAKQMIQVLSLAIASGNLAEAQQAYSKLQANMGDVKGRGYRNGGPPLAGGGSGKTSAARDAKVETYV